MLGALSVADQERVVAAMRTIEGSLCEAPTPQIPYLLRTPRPGDMGWIVSRHGALYREEYGWDERLEALIAEIVAGFVRNHDRERERCWIAERASENVGSVLLVRETDQVARLRLLLVEPRARGLGIGARLVEEAVRFAREVRYRKLTLWTHTVLTAARRVYERAGFKLTDQWTHDMFGKQLSAETWDLELHQQ
jgi:GNAT superfamily N-acetyltransferase